MKIAIFEPYLAEKGGAQKVIGEYSNYLQSKGHKVELFTQRYEPKTAYSEFNKLKINIIKPINKNLSSLAFNQKIKGFDLLISNDFPSNFISIKNKPTLWVCYSPKRYFYDLKKYYYKNALFNEKILLFLKHLLFKKKDLISAKKTSLICPISKTVKERVKKYYNISKSYVFYCGIYFKDYKKGEYKNYILCVSRFVKPKRISLAIKSMGFVKNKKIKLYVVGSGPEEENLRKLTKKYSNVELLGEVDDKKLKKLFSNCLATLFVPINEDWGLVPLEAAASGKTTISVNEGALWRQL